jgi:hypothetical protein
VASITPQSLGNEEIMKTILNLTVLAALACPIYAVDGVVLINQSNALAGNVTPGDTPGFPVTISVPGSYRLSGNLTVPDANTTAINIAANNVTIDLNGFSIIGPTVCSFNPITCSPKGTGDGIVGLNVFGTSVFNGTIQGMGDRGINLLGDSLRVEKVLASNNGIIGLHVFGDNSLVSSCIATKNGGPGIFIGHGIVTGSLVLGNGGDGISFTGLAKDNDAEDNRGNGIIGQGLFSGNYAILNASAGISARCPSSITANTATDNLGGNIFTSGSGCKLDPNNNAAP